METFDVVLFSPPSRMINHYRPPLGLLYVGGYLTHAGLKVKIIDIPLKDQVRNRIFFENIEGALEDIHARMIDEFRRIKTRVAGIACYTPEYDETVRLAADIKKIDPDVIVVAGGVHPTFYPQDFFDGETGIDICVRGDGEVTLYEVAQAFSGPDGWEKIHSTPGIAFFDRRAGKMALTPDRAIHENLDDVSFPDYSLIDMDYYTTANPYAIRGCFLRSMYLLSTRGCPSQCTFCVAKGLRKFNSGGRKRSAEGLIAELRALKESYTIDGFYFIDDLFTIDKNNVARFCRLLKQEKLNLLWGCSSKVSTLNEDVLKMMAEAGCVQIDFGVERGSDEALQAIKKGINIAAVRKIFALCHRYGIRTFANMLVNLPGETEKDLDDILRLLDDIGPEIVSLNIFTPYPGTELYERLPYRFNKNEYKRLSENPTRLLENFPDQFRFCKHAVDLKKWVVENTRRYNKILPNIAFYLSPRYWRALLKSRAKKNYLQQSGALIREFINQKF